jgi:hypothetical protein
MSGIDVDDSPVELGFAGHRPIIALGPADGTPACILGVSGAGAARAGPGLTAPVLRPG